MSTEKVDASHVLMNGECPGWNVNADPPSSDGTSSTADTPDGKGIKRETWARKFDFLLACIGFSVGLGNVWRFPFLCYRNGGGAFLIPYFIAVVLGGIPVFFLEVSLGQFMSEGGIGPWKICPLFQGIGYASTVIVFLLNCDYNIILTWAFYYLFSSFTSRLPWSHCDNAWNTPNCSVYRTHPNASDDSNSTETILNGTAINATHVMASNASQSPMMDPVTEFWERYRLCEIKRYHLGDIVLTVDFAQCPDIINYMTSQCYDVIKYMNHNDDVGSPGSIKWDLALCLLLAWIVVYFCIWKGIKSSGKVMYFTATSPYILMFVLLIRGVTLEGAVDGLKYYLLPEWHRLLDPQVWVDAGTQIFFSYSISLGTLTALGSYNKFHHNVWRDAVCFSLVNSLTSFLAGFVIFSVLGFMAFKQGVSIDKVAESGPGLAFIAYPEAVSQMPVAPLWSCLFFIMIILLGLDSQFVGVEGFVTAVVDMFPTFLRKGHRREIFIAIVCTLSFFIGLSMVTEGGMYVFQLFDYYSASRIVLVVAFFECIVVSYIYGVNRFYDNLQMMFGFPLNPFMKICWTVLTPVFTLVIFILGVITYSELTYDRKTITYIYPSWAISIGWMMASASVIFIPGVMIFQLIAAKGSLFERINKLTRPRLRRHQIRENEDMSKIDIIDDIYQDTANISCMEAGEKIQVTMSLLNDPKLSEDCEQNACPGETTEDKFINPTAKS